MSDPSSAENQFETNPVFDSVSPIDPGLSHQSSPSPQRPLSPSIVLQQQKLRSKQSFLSPQFDTSCFVQSDTDPPTGSQTQSTIEIVTSLEPEVTPGTSRVCIDRTNATSSIATNNNVSPQTNASTSASPNPAQQMPINVLKYRFVHFSSLILF